MACGPCLISDAVERLLPCYLISPPDAEIAALIRALKNLGRLPFGQGPICEARRSKCTVGHDSSRSVPYPTLLAIGLMLASGMARADCPAWASAPASSESPARIVPLRELPLEARLADDAGLGNYRFGQQALAPEVQT